MDQIKNTRPQLKR